MKYAQQGALWYVIFPAEDAEWQRTQRGRVLWYVIFPAEGAEEQRAQRCKVMWHVFFHAESAEVQGTQSFMDYIFDSIDNFIFKNVF